MDKENKNVLIIGYGKIGKIKSYLWSENVSNVYIYDKKIKNISNNDSGFIFLNEILDLKIDYIDISTPSSTHIQVLEEVLSSNIRFEKIIIEKPLFNDSKSHQALLNLLNNYPEIIKKIFVNEQYYSSVAIKELKEKITMDKVQEIHIEMSKNRLEDTYKGRFFDEDLETYGIELPHIMSVLDSLNVNNFENFEIIKNIHYIDESNPYNQGLEIKIIYNNISIFIKSFLGDFRINSDELEANKITRYINITSRYDQNYIVFDPHPLRERYISELKINKKNHFIEDNMLKVHIKNIVNDTESLKKKYGVYNVINLNLFILKLYEQRKVKYISYLKEEIK